MASSSSSKRVTKFEDIPEDIIFDEILTRLPVKSLCRFKCVSRTWLSIISSERFVKTHLLLYSPNSRRIMLNITHPNNCMMDCSPHSLFSENLVTGSCIDFPVDDYKLIAGSCNGLLCVFVGNFNYESFDFFLWNPSTRKHLKLPPADVGGDMAWASFGFTYDESKDDYTLLLISYMGNGSFRSHTKLYRSRTNSWKRIGDFDRGFPVYHTQGKFVSGKFHFAICPEDSYDFEYEHSAVVFDIVSFDLEREEFGVVEHPEYGDNVAHLSLEELEGSLCVLCIKGTHVDLWVMKEYGNTQSWNKMATFRYNYFYSKPLIISQSREMLLLCEVNDVHVDQHCFVVYDLNKNTERLPETYNFGNFQEADVYVESLVWPIMDLVK